MKDKKKYTDHIPTPIIDIFAGPGGLGEGFMSVVNNQGKRNFKIVLSIEKDEFAHQTLTLRSFVRQFELKNIPKEYYEFISGKITKEELYKIYPNEYSKAKEEAWMTTLGKETAHSVVDKKIKVALEKNENWILIGGPPCQAYSIVGRSRRQEKELNPDDDRVFLYREYYRILAVHNPPVFIMENVKGLLSSKVNNDSMFKHIINDLEDPAVAFNKLNNTKTSFNCPGYHIYSLVKPPKQFDLNGKPEYNVKDFVIKAEDYGIPQTRHRIILMGIRKDIAKISPSILKKAKGKIPVSKVLFGLPNLRSGLSKTKDSKDLWKESLEHFSDNGLLSGCDKMVMQKIKKTIASIRLPQKDRGDEFIDCIPSVKYNTSWYIDRKLKGITNHETRSHIVTDLYRYMFTSCFAKIYMRSPKMSEFPRSILPAHLNVEEAINDNKFADRFRVQLSNQPAKTVTSHISKDGHYYIHPEPTQCRSFTVREAARIQTFPDNYYFCGPRTSQYHQVGNAVPPYLAFQIAKIVSKTFTNISETKTL
jgi:DNA (cytosine-5)-methyltransferase 1